MDSVKKQRFFEILINIIILLGTPAVFVLPAYYAERSFSIALRMGAVAFLMGLMVVYALEEMRIGEEFLAGNKSRQKIFLLFYFFSLGIAVMARLVSPFLLPVSAAVLMCMLFSGFISGIAVMITVCTCIMLSAGVGGFTCIYLVSVSFVTLLLFRKAKKPMYCIRKSVMLVFISLALYCVLILLGQNEISASDIINPAAGIIINFVMMLILVQLYQKYIISAYEDVYERFNDPEHELLQQLKSKNSEEYNTAIHSAYICDKISVNMKFDNVLSKSLGYYHRIGVINGKNIKTETVNIAEQYSFPPMLKSCLSEYQKVKNVPPSKSETIICVLAVDIVNSIRYILKNEKQSQNVDYDKIIDFVFQKRYDSGLFSKSSLSMSDVEKMKGYFKEEKLYYDFLR